MGAAVPALLVLGGLQPCPPRPPQAIQRVQGPDQVRHQGQSRMSGSLVSSVGDPDPNPDMLLGLLDPAPDPLVRYMDPDPAIIMLK